MTKERKLAIEMWQDIREKISNGTIHTGIAMYDFKLDWLKAHNIDWYDGCWLCHYFRKAREDEEYADEDEEYADEDEEYAREEESTKYPSKTPKCPLNRYRPSRCDGYCVQYAIACKPKYSMKQRLAAIDNIIKALKGEYNENND